MSIKGPQSLRRKATRGNENRRCTVLVAVKNVKSGFGKPWFKKAPVGVNKHNTLMKTMAQKAELGPNFKNHSGRKTMIQALANNYVPPTDFMQLPGVKNAQSITSYSTVSGADPEFYFRRGCTRLLLYFNTNKPNSIFFLENTSCIRQPQVISGGEGCAPPAPSPWIRPCVS